MNWLSGDEVSHGLDNALCINVPLCMGNHFVCGLSYADDITLLPSTLKMVKTCDVYANEFNVKFSSTICNFFCVRECACICVLQCLSVCSCVRAYMVTYVAR